MNDQVKALSIIDLYAEEHHMHRDALIATLMQTVMPRDKNGKDIANQADIAAFLQLARAFKLNPWAKEIYCIMTRGAVKPYISVDGYSAIVNRQPEFDGCEFGYEQDDNGQFLSVTCTMWRKDRSHPIVVTEFLSECRTDSEPWRKSPSRMLRHRAFIQAARLCFGISAAFDDDGAPAPIDVTPVQEVEMRRPTPQAPKQPPKVNGSPARAQQPAPAPETPAEPVKPSGVPEIEEYVNELHDRLNEAQNVEQLRQIWVDMNPAQSIMPNEAMMRYAQGIYDRLETKFKAA